MLAKLSEAHREQVYQVSGGGRGSQLGGPAGASGEYLHAPHGAIGADCETML